MEFATDPGLTPVAIIKSPPSTAFPDDAMVTYSMTFVTVGTILPPAIQPLVLSLNPADKRLAAPKLPKSIAFPSVGTVT